MRKIFTQTIILSFILSVTAVSAQSPDKISIFAEVLQRRNADNPSQLVTLVPQQRTIIAEEKQLRNGKTVVLLLPLVLENQSGQELTTTISHEWFGGLHPRTDLYAAVKKQGERKEYWDVQTVHLAGELGSAAGATILPNGEQKNLMIRLNWPGTGSVPVSKLINETEAGSYKIRFCLVYTSSGKSWYLETPETVIELKASSGRQ